MFVLFLPLLPRKWRRTFRTQVPPLRSPSRGRVVITQAQTGVSCLLPSGPYLALQPHTIQPDILTRARAPLGQDLYIVSLVILATARYLLC